MESHLKKFDDLINLSHAVSKFVIGAEGNVSVKYGNDILIKASGKSLSTLTAEDIIWCNYEGMKLCEDDLEPSMEIGFHKWLLTFGEINFVCHTHPIHCLQILCSEYVDEFARKRLFPDQVIFNGKEYCVVDYKHPGQELCDEIQNCVMKFWKKNNELPKVILLKNHGIIAIGSTAKECLIQTEMCEKAAEIFIGTKITGHVNSLSDADILKLTTDKKEDYRKGLFK
jgi:ribulose-5-phosphate 4-epimerase/fuculose-1-phosphate aldolase